jgi:type II secretory pathway component PulK
LNVELLDDQGEYTALLRFVVTNLVRGGNQTTGVDTETDSQVSTIVDSLLDWRDCDDEAKLNGAETAYYAGLPRPYTAKNGFFSSADELMRIKGVTPDIFYGHDDSPGFTDVFSPYPRGEALVINAGQVTAQVVRALVPRLTLAEAEEYVALRRDDPQVFKDKLAMDVDAGVPGLGARVAIVEPKYVRVEARADLSQARNQADVAAVVELAGADFEEPVIHSWLDRAPLSADGPDKANVGTGATKADHS